MVSNPKTQSERRSPDEPITRRLMFGVLYFLNSIYIVFGLGVAALAIYVLIDKSSFLHLLASLVYRLSFYVIIIAGIFVSVVGVISWIATNRKNKRGLCASAVLLFVIILMACFSGGAFFMLFREQVYNDLENNLNETISAEYGQASSEQVTSAVDEMQQSFQCCGAHDFRDWSYTEWSSSVETDDPVPDSCCITLSEGCGTFSSHFSNIFYKGCVAGLAEYLQEHLLQLSFFVFGLLVILALGVICNCCLYFKLSNSKSLYESAPTNPPS